VFYDENHSLLGRICGSLVKNFMCKNVPYIILGILAITILYIWATFQVTVTVKNKDKDWIVSNKSGLRESCLMCYRKHIGQARALIDESKLGYPSHIYLALGHMAEAEAESIKDYPELARKTREYRTALYNGQNADLMELINDATALANKQTA